MRTANEIVLGVFLRISGGIVVVLVGARRALLRDARPEKSRVCTKPSSVLAERKLLMRLDGVCRHYLAMTKSALFLFTGGGKFNRGTRKKKASENRF